MGLTIDYGPYGTSLTHSLTPSLPHSLTHLLTHHSLTHSLTHSSKQALLSISMMILFPTVLTIVAVMLTANNQKFVNGIY
jgi:hypothetical protein